MTTDPVSFTMKAGDLLPKLTVTLTTTAGAAIDLTTALAVQFRMWRVDARPTGSFKVNAAATFDDRPNGVVSYLWAGTDTDTPGLYYAEIVLTWPGPKPQTVPTSGYMVIQIEDSGLPG